MIEVPPVALRFVRAAPASVTLDFVVPSGKDAIDSLRTSAGVKLTARTQDDVPTRYRQTLRALQKNQARNVLCNEGATRNAPTRLISGKIK